VNFSLEIAGEKDSGEFCDLFRSESKYPSEYYFWQDRKPDFFACYSHLKMQPANYLRWRDERGILRACFGLIPMGELQSSPICYLTVNPSGVQGGCSLHVNLSGDGTNRDK
jgi:hypothetical protein